jgi:hypothetical protein
MSFDPFNSSPQFDPFASSGSTAAAQQHGQWAEVAQFQASKREIAKVPSIFKSKDKQSPERSPDKENEKPAAQNYKPKLKVEVDNHAFTTPTKNKSKEKHSNNSASSINNTNNNSSSHSKINSNNKPGDANQGGVEVVESLPSPVHVALDPASPQFSRQEKICSWKGCETKRYAW